jgi:DHA2 family multidrug resistance protein-like MFS transporter
VNLGANDDGAGRSSYSPTLLGRSHHLAGAHAFRTRRLDSQRRSSDDRRGPQRPGSGLGVGGQRLHSRSQSEPIVPFDLLKNPVFSLSVATSIASFASQMLAFVSLPFFFESALHRSQVETGLLMTPWPLAVGIGAPIAGRLADRVSAAVLGAAGLAVLCAGLALLAGLPKSPTAAEIAWRMALCGLGFGFFQAPNNRSMLSAAPLARSGAAGGMPATARLTGQTIGAILAAISFRIAGHSETVALGMAAALAAIAAVASGARLYHPDGARPVKPAIVADAP